MQTQNYYPLALRNSTVETIKYATLVLLIDFSSIFV